MKNAGVYSIINCGKDKDKRMKHMDILSGILLAGILYFYGKGYLLFSGQIGGLGEECVAYAILCAICLLLLLRRMADRRYLRMSMKKVDRLSGRRFEKYLRAQFKHLGYRVTLTEFSHDYGADLIVKKHGEKIVVQAKRYERNVGIAAVQEAVGAIAYYDADRAMVVTNSGFTKSARNLARQNEVELWGRHEIQKKFKIRS